jgi:guanylate kinase
MSTLIVITGGSGSGKTFLLNNVGTISKDLSVIKRKTTRTMRIQEKGSLNHDLEFGSSSESIYQSDFYYSFRNDWYGINKVSIENVLKRGKIPIFIIRRVSAILELRQAFPNKVKTILCQSGFLKNELVDYLLNKGVPFQEAQERVFGECEEQCNNEYEENHHLFDCKITNHYNNKFIEDARNFVLNNIY